MSTKRQYTEIPKSKQTCNEYPDYKKTHEKHTEKPKPTSSIGSRTKKVEGLARGGRGPEGSPSVVKKY